MRFASLLLVATVAGASLSAQSRSTWFVSGGLSVPTGEFNTYADNGWDVTGGWEHAFGAHRTALRLDLSYATNTDTSGAGFHEATHIITAMANFVYHFTDSHPRLYALVGLGMFARRFSTDDPDDLAIHDSHLGFQVGEGVVFRVKSARVYIEGRFVETLSAQRMEFFPIVAGVRFGGGR